MLAQCLLVSRLQQKKIVSRYLRTVSRYESRDKYRDASMNRADTSNDDFGVEAFWAIHCAHWSSGFMVLNASISRVLGQRPMFYCPEVGARTYLYSPYYSAINVQCSYEKTK